MTEKLDAEEAQAMRDAAERAKEAVLKEADRRDGKQ